MTESHLMLNVNSLLRVAQLKLETGGGVNIVE